MNHQLILLLLASLMAGLISHCPATAAPRDSDGSVNLSLQRSRRTIGSATAFVNCLEVGNSSRFCSYDHDLLEAIERAAATTGSSFRSCPEGRVFRHRCNTCECKKDGAMACSTDLCAEDFYDARTGLPKLW